MATPKDENDFREYLQRFKGRKLSDDGELSDDDEEAIKRFYTNRGISDARAKEIQKEVLEDQKGQSIPRNSGDIGTSKNEIAFREYLQRFKGQKLSNDGELSDDDKEVIERFYTNRGISDARAKAILKEVLGDQTEPIDSDSTVTEEEGGSSTTGAGGSEDDAGNDLGNTGGQDGLSTTEIDEKIEEKIDPPVDPMLSPEYNARLEEYGKFFLQKLQETKDAFTDDKAVVEVDKRIREELEKRRIELNLERQHTAQKEQDVRGKYMLGKGLVELDEDETDVNNGHTVSDKSNIKEDDRLKKQFESLEDELNEENYKEADKITFEILVKVIEPRGGWFDDTSFRRFKPTDPDKKAIQKLNQLWEKTQKFGFSYQLGIYDKIVNDLADLKKDQFIYRKHALEFSKTVGWWLPDKQAEWWFPPLNFFKFYFLLRFSKKKAPTGHLPALWFWEIPGGKAFQHGGIWKGRGGCGIDSVMIPAFMQMLKDAGIKPVSPGNEPPAAANPQKTQPDASTAETKNS